MQSIGTLLSDNKGWAIVAVLFAAVVVIAILIFLYRFVFGRRLHMAGGRSRQPRLGVVDAFDLDRQRQLVLVRRDNVEHLLMIGGPNDVVIESAFVRAQPSVAVPTGRDKEGAMPMAPLIPMPSSNGAMPEAVAPAEPKAAAPPASPPPEPPAPAARPAPPPLDLGSPVSARDLGPLSDIPAPGPVAASAPPPPPAPPPSETVEETPPAPSLPEPVAATVAPARQPLSRLANGLVPRPAGVSLPPRPPLTSLRPQGSAAPPSGAPTPPRPPSALPNRPSSFPLQRGTSAASLRRDPQSPVAAVTSEFPVAEPAKSPSPPVALQAVKAQPATPSITLDSIESLEEEMAKLLGRASNDKG